jgi:hypothetical protein
MPPVIGFYLAGGALAAWAVILSFLGITRPTFPGSRRGERAVVTISIVLVALAVAGGIAGGIIESGEAGHAAASSAGA